MSQDTTAPIESGDIQPQSYDPDNPPKILPPKSHLVMEFHAEDEKVAGRMWLVSFTDLAALLLTFFVMLFSMKDVNLEVITALTGSPSMHKEAVTETKKQPGGDQKGDNIERISYGAAIDLDYLQGVLKQSIAQAGLENDVRISHGADHLKLIVDADLEFSDDGLAGESARIASGLAERLHLLSNRITVVGLPGRAYSGDWDITLARAGAFAAEMREGGYNRSFIVVGEANGRGPAIEIRVEADDGRVR